MVFGVEFLTDKTKTKCNCFRFTETSNGTVEKSSAEKVTRLKHFPMQVNIRLKHRKMNAEKRKKTLAFNASRTFSG